MIGAEVKQRREGDSADSSHKNSCLSHLAQDGRVCRITLLIIIFLVLAISIAIRGGFFGQDLSYHLHFTDMVFSGTPPWRIHGSADPMLLYAIGALSEMLSWPNSTVLFASLLFCIENALAAFLLWRCAKRLLPRTYDAWYVAFLVTLPVFVITSVVFASDALVLLPFAVYCISAIRLLEERGVSGVIPLSLAACIAQIIGGLAKFTAVSLVPASALLSLY